MTLNLSKVMKGEAIAIFPYFDLERAGAAHNILSLASWSLVSTLPYLEFAVPLDAGDWHKQYARVLLAFEEGPGRGPNAAVQAWPQVIRHVFVVKD